MIERAPIRKRRYTVITAEQDDLLQAAARRRGKTETAVFNEIVEAGFEAYFARQRRAFPAEEPPPGGEVYGAALGALSASLWSSFSTLGIVRQILRELGYDVDSASGATYGISRFMNTHNVGEQTRVWRSIGRNLAEGRDFDVAVSMACAEQRVDFDEFAGRLGTPRVARAGGQPSRDSSGQGRKGKKGRKGNGGQQGRKVSGNGDR